MPVSSAVRRAASRGLLRGVNLATIHGSFNTKTDIFKTQPITGNLSPLSFQSRRSKMIYEIVSQTPQSFAPGLDMFLLTGIDLLDSVSSRMTSGNSVDLRRRIKAEYTVCVYSNTSPIQGKLLQMLPTYFKSCEVINFTILKV